MFFLLIYTHVGRGLYYGSYRFMKTWVRGVTILLLRIGTAFLGYVLPWGQISFWAATVITNLLSAIPYVGLIIVEWVWGGFSVGDPTLTRFYRFHFILPFVIIFAVLLHLLFLHETGSGNPIGLRRDLDKISFHPFFSVKDVFGIVGFFMGFIALCFLRPYVFIDVENFIPSNPIVTPVHIQPEWYFLFAYTILRSVRRKIGGVIALLISVLILYTLPFFLNIRFRGVVLYSLSKVVYWVFIIEWLVLTWIGACEVDYPFIEIGMVFRSLYFLRFLFFWLTPWVQDELL